MFNKLLKGKGNVGKQKNNVGHGIEFSFCNGNFGS